MAQSLHTETVIEIVFTNASLDAHYCKGPKRLTHNQNIYNINPFSTYLTLCYSLHAEVKRTMLSQGLPIEGKRRQSNKPPTSHALKPPLSPAKSKLSTIRNILILKMKQTIIQRCKTRMRAYLFSAGRVCYSM